MEEQTVRVMRITTATPDEDIEKGLDHLRREGWSLRLFIPPDRLICVKRIDFNEPTRARIARLDALVREAREFCESWIRIVEALPMQGAPNLESRRAVADKVLEILRGGM